MNHRDIAKELLKRDEPDLAKEVLSLSRPKKRIGVVKKLFPNYILVEDNQGELHTITYHLNKLHIGDHVTLTYRTVPSADWFMEKQKTFANQKELLSFSTNDIRFYESLPAYTPTTKTQGIQKKLNVSPDWRYLDNDKLKSRAIRNNNIIMIAKQDNHDVETELHELGHHFYDTLPNKSGWSRVYRHFIKKAPQHQSDWRVIDDNLVFVGRANEGVLEAFADVFKWYFLGKLQMTDGGIGQVMKILTGVS